MGVKGEYGIIFMEEFIFQIFPGTKRMRIIKSFKMAARLGDIKVRARSVQLM